MSDLTVTMIRCSTLLLQWRGLRLLTDPWFRMHIRGIPCLRRPGLAVEQLGALDALLVSHLHPDHFDRQAVSRMQPRPGRVLLPPGALDRLGRTAGPGWQELAPWSETAIGELRVWSVPGPHTLPGPEEINFVLELPDWGRVFFGGDARYHGPTLAEIGRRFAPIKLALLPVGGTLILGQRTVMTPEQAQRASRLLEAETVIPIHEGGIWLSVPPLSWHPGRARQLAEIAARLGHPRTVHILAEGESMELG